MHALSGVLRVRGACTRTCLVFSQVRSSSCWGSLRTFPTQRAFSDRARSTSPYQVARGKISWRSRSTDQGRKRSDRDFKKSACRSREEGSWIKEASKFVPLGDMPSPSARLLETARKARTDADLAHALYSFRTRRALGYYPSIDGNPDLATRLALFEVGAVEFCKEVVGRRDVSPEALDAAWAILQDVSLTTNANDPKEDESLHRGVQAGLIQLAVWEFGFKPPRGTEDMLGLAARWFSEPAMERHMDVLICSGAMDACVGVMRDWISSGNVGDILPHQMSCLRALGGSSRFRPGPLRDKGVVEVMVPLLHLLESPQDDLSAAGYTIASTIVRLVGSSETSRIVKQHPVIVGKLVEMLSGALKSGPKEGFLYKHSNIILAGPVFNIKLVSLSDANKPLLKSAVDPLVHAVSLYGEDDKPLTHEGLQALAQLSFDEGCRGEILKWRKELDLVVEFCTEHRGFVREDVDALATLMSVFAPPSPSSSLGDAQPRRHVTLMQRFLPKPRHRLGESENRRLVGEERAKGSKDYVYLSYHPATASPQRIRVHDFLLEQDVPVWGGGGDEIKTARGSDLARAIGAAVGGAQVVFAFLTRRYKESARCRQECQFALAQGKPIVYLMVEDKYKPDGWLGLQMGNASCLDARAMVVLEGQLPQLLALAKGEHVPHMVPFPSSSYDPGARYDSRARTALLRLERDLRANQAKLEMKQAELRRELKEIKVLLQALINQST